MKSTLVRVHCVGSASGGAFHLGVGAVLQVAPRPGRGTDVQCLHWPPSGLSRPRAVAIRSALGAPVLLLPGRRPQGPQDRLAAGGTEGRRGARGRAVAWCASVAPGPLALGLRLHGGCAFDVTHACRSHLCCGRMRGLLLLQASGASRL